MAAGHGRLDENHRYRVAQEMWSATFRARHVPNQLRVDYNAHVLESILKYVAPALGWR